MATFAIEFQRNVVDVFDGNDEYCEISVVIEELVEAVIALEHNENVIQYLTVEMIWTIISAECSLVNSV